MKNTIIILALVFIAFTVDAQSTKSRSTGEKKSTEKVESTSKSPSKGTANPTSSSPSGSSATRATSSSSNESAVKSRGSSSVESSTPTSRNSSSTTRSSNSDRSSSGRTTAPSQTSSSSSTRSSTNTGRDADAQSGSSYNRGRSAGESTNSPARTRTNESGGRNGNSSNSGVNEYEPRTSTVYAERRRTYNTYMPNRVVRPHTHNHYIVKPIEYRRTHYHYREPAMLNIYWDTYMYHEYRSWYPHYDLWYYPYGYSIHTISAYDAYDYIGEIARVYGGVDEVWYEESTDQYFLYIGAPYPYNDVTVIVDGRDARWINRNPVRYFTKSHIEVTGLVSSFDGKPEIVVKDRKQIRRY